MDIKSVIKAHGYTIERIANEWESKKLVGPCLNLSTITLLLTPFKRLQML